MARGKRQPELKDGELPLAVQQLITEADEIDEAFSELPAGETKISVYRMRDQGRPAYIQFYTLADFSIETIRERHGGGKFKLVAKSGDEKVERIVEIEGSPIVRTAYPRAPGGWGSKEDGEQLPSFSRNGGDPIYGAILDSLKEIRRALDRPPETGLIGLVTTLLTNRPSSEDLEDKLLAKLATFKSLFAGNESRVESNVIFDAMRSGMELISNVEAREGSPWLVVAEKLLPTIQGVLAQVVQAQQKGPRPATGQPLTAPEKPPEATHPEPPKTGFDAIAPKLTPFLPTFIQAAASDSDPALLVDLTAGQIPDDNKQVVIDWLKSSLWFQQLMTLNPAIQLQRAWWGEFHEGLLARLTGVEQETEPE